jgi:hypothetical protein
VSGLVRHRPSRWRRLAVRLAVVFACGALTATLAAALQAHAIRVSGTSRFSEAEVENALRFALGTPTVALRADTLRAAVRAVPWVADAQVQISIDGVVSCEVVERQPFATAVDGADRVLLDADGRVLGAAGGERPGPELRGFAADSEGRAAVLHAAPGAERAWGARLVHADRVGPRDVLLVFADTECGALVDPSHPERLALARRVLTAWTAATGVAPLRVDMRVAGRAAVMPAPPAAEPDTPAAGGGA